MWVSCLRYTGVSDSPPALAVVTNVANMAVAATYAATYAATNVAT